ncbi:MAG: YjgN family protein [Pseudomonadota bacterium]
MSQEAPAVSQEIPFEFRGTASEYFGIWIVNILLMILTLGIYSAWAKVRTNRYFYGNTLLEDVPFAYLALPLTILKGWAIAVVALILYSVITNVIPWTAIIFLAVLLVALPWIVIRAMAFRARNSAHRNIRFTFNASYGEAAKVFIGLTLLLPLTLGLIYPYYVFAMNRFLVNHSGYGTTPFHFTASFKDFYRIFFKLSLMLLPFVLLLLAAMYPAYQQYMENARAAQEIEQAMAQEQPMEDQAYGAGQDIPSGEEDAYGVTEDSQSMSEDGQPIASDEALANEDPASSQYQYEAEQSGAAAEYSQEGTLGEEAAQAEVTEQDAIDAGEPPAGEADLEVQYAPWVWLAVGAVSVVFIAGLVFYLFVYAYIKARIQNLVYNSAELAGHRFRSRLRARDLVWLYFSNALAIFLSLGLLIPWAKIRLARYRISKLALLPAGGLAAFVQAEKERINALGEEVGEVFDIDVGV